MSLNEMKNGESAQRAPPPALCVTIHDVAPHTWSRCAHWLRAIRAVANIPVTLLVVPNYHCYRVYSPAKFEGQLDQCLSQGDELALHGYTHLDEGPTPTNYWNKIVRQVYTRGEGEFYSIDTLEARRRLEMGMAWFSRNQWPITGFVAPAWLLGTGGWEALQEFPFQYTTTMRRFHLLPERTVISSPSLVYSVRNAWRRQAWRAGNSILYCANRNTSLVRLGLHPDDVLHPDIVRHAQQLIEKLLESRVAVTKITFANSLRKTQFQKTKILVHMGWKHRVYRKKTR